MHDIGSSSRAVAGTSGRETAIAASPSAAAGSDFRRRWFGVSAGRAFFMRVLAIAGLALAGLTACSSEQPAVDEAQEEGAVQENESAQENAAVQESGPAQTAMLEPGEYESPLVQLQRLQGENGHLHVDEVRYRASDQKLFQCSYTFGVVDASNPADMDYLAEQIRHEIPDVERLPMCIHLAPDGDIVYTTHRGTLRNPAFLSGWDISKTDPEDPDVMVPEQLAVVQEPGVSYEGVDVANGHIYVAIREDGLGVYRRDSETGQIARVGELGNIGSTWGLRAQGDTVYLTDIYGHLVTVDVTDPENPALLGTAAIDGVPRARWGLPPTARMSSSAIGGCSTRSGCIRSGSRHMSSFRRT